MPQQNQPKPQDTAPDATPDKADAQKPPKEKAASATHYIITHDGVDNWVRGNVVTASDLPEGSIERLTRLGAIAPYVPDEE